MRREIYGKSINNNNLVIKQLYCNKISNYNQEEITLNINLENIYVGNNKINLTNYTNENINENYTNGNYK